MTARLFKRSARLTAALGNPVAGEWFGSIQAIQDQLVINRVAGDPGLRIKFDIERDLSKNPNRAKITVSNLSLKTRQSLQNSKPLLVTLEVGYDDKLEQIFSGDVTLCESTHDRTDWLTKLESGDGDRAVSNASINASFADGVSTKQVLSRCAAALGLALPTNVSQAQALLSQFAGGGGLSLHGSVSDVMTKILTPSGLGWSIQDGQLQILGPGEVTADSAVPCSQATGMIGVPAYDLPKSPGKPAVLKVKMLCNPACKPGRLLLMDSSAIKGSFRIEKCKHSGDTHSNAWFTELHAVMV